MNEISLAIICSSNMNRSMEAHNYLAKKKFKVMCNFQYCWLKVAKLI